LSDAVKIAKEYGVGLLHASDVRVIAKDSNNGVELAKDYGARCGAC
jgi:hypothetical protein